ncbi:uncharacterized protein LOC122665411 [Telopea speciosissima]|uniref:uncharacterized protein LOC122665411 n=1 Tax=Telopea speciosissima TaxID=54955 RepID=UPI001CC3D0D9|nr:uncharacterized protein LOC122665411 [Telopea speciosissima]
MDYLLSGGPAQPPSISRGFSPPEQAEACALCGDPNHYVTDCYLAAQYPEFIQEKVQAAQGFANPGNDPFSNTYNPGWQNHPNFSWKTPPNPPFRPPFNAQPNAYRGGQQQPYSQPQHTPSFESEVMKVLKGIEQKVGINDQLLHSHTHSISKLETQIGQLAEAFNKRETGQLPSQPIGNPNSAQIGRSKEQVQSVRELRNGERVKIHDTPPTYEDFPSNTPQQTTPAESTPAQAEVESKALRPLIDGNRTIAPSLVHSQENTKKEYEQPVGEGPQPDKYTPRVPFPDALKTPSSPPFGKQGEKMKEMLDLFQQVHINLPLLDAIKQVPAYAKFLKDLCTQKHKLRNQTPKTIHLTEQVSAVITDLPPKLKDPGAPLISCVIGDLSIDKALLDLGASVNILLGSVFEKFGLGELKSTEVILQLVDRSVKRPRGLLEDVLVKVDDLYFPVDFLVLDMESTSPKLPPIILGHPLLATTNAYNNCRSGSMDISFGNKKLWLNIFNASLGPYREDECFALNMIAKAVSQYTS